MTAPLEAPPQPAHPSASQSIRRRLLLLTLSVLIPTSGISLIAAYTMYSEARQSVTQLATYTARALSLVADRELAHRAGVLHTLAASPALDRNDLGGFYEQAKAVTYTYATSVVLTDASGQHLLNTGRPFNSGDLPKTPFAPGEVGRLDGKPVISDLVPGAQGKEHSFSVRVPVVRHGEVRWYVSMGSLASRMQRIFDQQDLPAGWTGTLLDSKGRVVARNIHPEKYIGRTATADMLARMDGNTFGTQESVTFDGVPVVSVFNRAPDSGWSVVIGMPRAELRRPALQALVQMLVISLILSAVAVLGAVGLGRGIARPLARLLADAQALGRGQPVTETPTGLMETDFVQRSLAKASQELQEADSKLHSQVRRAVEEAERAQRAALSAQKLEALGRLTGGIAHDFNNLLQTLSSGVALATKLSADPRTLKVLATCDRAVNRAVKLTRQLMSFGRAQPGHLEHIQLQDQFDGLGDLLRGALRESVQLEMHAEPGIWPLEIDPVQLELALLNLALNARDAIAGVGVVQVKAANRRLAWEEVPGLPAGDYVSLVVSDSGHGIAPDLLPRIFEPFFTTKPLGKGTGLGLAQVYAFATQSRGVAQVHSTPGQGTRVTLLLPRVDTPAQSAPPQRDGQPSEARYSGTVLLVEDDALVRGLTAEILQDAGYNVLVASSADDALAICLARSDIDVVLSDIMMPGRLSGIELVIQLKRQQPHLRVLLASGYAAVPDAPLPARVLAKPYDTAQLAKWLAEEIALGRAAQNPAA